MLLAMGCILSILSVPALGEKGSLESEWMGTLAENRSALGRFQTTVETWRYEVLNATGTIDLDWTKEWFLALEAGLPRSTTGEVEANEGLTHLLDGARKAFGSQADAVEMLAEVVQWDASEDYLAFWERRSGDLSIYSSRGTWHQSDGTIALGPPSSLTAKEISLARIGFIAPRQTKTLTVPSATPESSVETMSLQVDEGETRFQIEVRPWLGEGGVRWIEESPILESEEGPVVERRVFLHFSEGGGLNPGAGALPDAGFEFRFDPRGHLLTYAVIRMHPPNTDEEAWEPFPSARPPFGWRVLDYRFLPEKEFVFGEVP